MTSSSSASPPVPSGTTAPGLITSPFGDAIQEFINSLPPKAKQPAFNQAYAASATPCGPDDVYQAALALERAHSKSTSAKIWRFIEPVIQALKDYCGVVDTLCQAYPTPSSLIWGFLKAVIECSNRYVEIYGFIESQLSQLSIQLMRLKEYEELFGKSPDMLNLLKGSYINILRFWHIVEQECSSKGRYKKAFRALTSFNARRLQDVLSSITQDAKNIVELTVILQEKSRRDDSETLGEIYNRMLEFQAELKAQEQAQKHFRKEAQKTEAWNTLRSMLQAVKEHNFQKAETLKCEQHSCSWLLSEPMFSDWFWEAEFPEIWVKAAPGAGKSTLCAYATSQARENFPNCGVVSHYFTFDDPLPLATIYRGIAFELAEPVFKQTEVPEHILQHILKMSGSPGELQELIEMLTEELPTVFVLLDGLDEEGDKGGPEWNVAEQVVRFFRSLASKEGARVRLWLSSQDQKRIREFTSDLPTLQVTEEQNGRAIEEYLAKRLSSFLPDEEEGVKNLVLKDLSSQAHGNFLWAHLMIEAVKDCPNLERVQLEIHKGLPKRHEGYYRRKMESLNISEHRFVSQILSCTAFAKRPLSVAELCEAVGMCQTSFKKDLQSKRRLLSKSVLDLCSPLVEVKLVGTKPIREVCVLSHASVKKFLVANPTILHQQLHESEYVHSDCLISEDKIAEACLKYLMQERFEQLLVHKDGRMLTSKGDDISELHFLTYAAKYWDKHYDEVEGTPERFKRIEDFLQSKNFRTCIQVQSLFVQGQFSPWRARNDSRVQDVLGWRRVFPHWFIKDNGICLRNDYYSFVREWAPFLNEVACRHGPHPGEVDRCFWGALGTRNFLYKFHRREQGFRSFLFPPDGHIDCSESCRYFEKIDESGNQVQVMRLQKSGDGSEYQLFCQRWRLDGHRPSSPHFEQNITVNRQGWDLYDKPLNKLVIGRPVPVECTSDFQYLRIASSVFAQSSSGDYQKLSDLELLEDRQSSAEEIAGTGKYLAVATRSRISRRDLWETGITDTTVEEINVAQFLNMIVSENQDKSTQASGSEGKSNGSSTDYGEPASTNSSQTSLSSRSLSTLEEESEKESENEIDALFQYESEDEQFEVESNSAEEFWSEGSTDPLSDESDDADLWNDWASADERLDSEKDWDGDQSSEVSLKVEENLPEDSDSEDFEVAKQAVKHRPPLPSPPRSSPSRTSSLDSSFSESFLGSSVSGSSESQENEGGAQLDELLWGDHNSSRNSTDPIARVEVFDTEDRKARLVFHFAQRIQKTLFSSHPLFHPSKPLLVWPIGGGELLFADYLANTYFIRTLRCSAPRSCHVFVKGQFSDCGEYLHFASLEARQAESLPGQELPPLKSFLQVSTHRLSSRKTTTSPPRLVYRTVIPLGESHSLPVSMMPYTLTWRRTHVYFSISGSQLDVIRIPLFRPPASSSSETAKPECLVLRERLWFPQSALFRPVYFFPPDPTAKKRKDQATVILGSSRGDAVLVSKKLVSSPSGLFFEEGKLGAEWKEKEDMGQSDNTMMEKLGARLLGKFESFDLKDDCDIVPYLT